MSLATKLISPLVSILPKAPCRWNGQWLWLPRGQWHAFRVEYEMPLLEPLARELSDAGGFLDVGAHHGEWSLWAWRSFPGLRILAVEPSDAFLTLEAALRANRATDRVGVLRSCVTTHGDGLTFHDSGDVTSSVSQEWAASRRQAVRSYTSPSITLARLIERMRALTPDEPKVVCKVDIEGHEEVVFADRTILDLPEVRFFVEVHNCAEVERSAVYQHARAAGREVTVIGRCYSPHVTVMF